MTTDNLNCEKIELTLPVNAAYVSAARLTASSISNRMGFNIEEIEDIKVAVSEACIFLIRQGAGLGFRNFHIEFGIMGKTLKIILNTIERTNGAEEYDENELGIKMISALMDSLMIDTTGGRVSITMVKKCK